MYLFRAVLRVVAVCIALCAAVFVYRNPEKATLDASVRAGVPGKFVALGGGTTHYEVAGPDTGRVVVLVHGFSVPAYIWDSTFTALGRAGFRVIRYDLYGRGYSDRPDAAYDGAFYDAQLDDLLTTLKVTEPVDLFGLSFGGYVVAHYATTHRQRLRTLTMVDPSSKRAVLPWYLTTPGLGYFLFQVGRVPGMAEGQSSDFLHPELHPDWADKYRPQMRYRGFGRALYRSMLTLGAADFPGMYATIGKSGLPVLLVWGKQDPTVPFANSAIVQQGIPSLEFFAVDSSGHLPHIEQSAAFDARVLAFLAAHPRGAVARPAAPSLP
jgi:pimeloyl-ACP methyl ester carboxylesterase